MGLCENCKITMCRAERDDVIGCSGFVAKDTNVLTNADRIRAMSDEELAGWLARTQIANVAEALAVARIPYEQKDGLKDEVAKECLEWLKQPADEAEG